MSVSILILQKKSCVLPRNKKMLEPFFIKKGKIWNELPISQFALGPPTWKYSWIETFSFFCKNKIKKERKCQARVKSSLKQKKVKKFFLFLTYIAHYFARWRDDELRHFHEAAAADGDDYGYCVSDYHGYVAAAGAPVSLSFLRGCYLCATTPAQFDSTRRTWR